MLYLASWQVNDHWRNEIHYDRKIPNNLAGHIWIHVCHDIYQQIVGKLDPRVEIDSEILSCRGIKSSKKKVVEVLYTRIIET